ncbi:hypothetical protein [Scrofimicrobium sp. R131]|uniref:MarR family transcriptional regulator n=1 Tax=Scrofimicrobium appendicitidis TaxID=3079930 RepID=A0AAU7V759_9ACTO
MSPEETPTPSLGTKLTEHMIRFDWQRHMAAQDAPLGAAALRLMWLLSDGQPRTLREISEELHLEQSTVNRQVNASIRAGNLARINDPNRAAQLLIPTEEGRRRFKMSTERVVRPYDRALEKMGPEAAHKFLELIEQFTTAYSDVNLEPTSEA